MNICSQTFTGVISVIIYLGIMAGSPVFANSRDDVPCGIYSLDSFKGGVTKSGIPLRDSNIRDYPFVKGYAWRTAWPYFETTEGIYDFSAIDQIIERLELINQELSLLLLPGEPGYIKEHQGVLTWDNNKGSKHRGSFAQFRSGTRIAPWDSYLMSRFESFIKALSEHKIYSHHLKQSVSLANHPSMKLINSGVPGYGSLRQNRVLRIADIPGYSRENLKKATLSSIHIIKKYFPTQNNMIGIWRINDGQRDPALSEYIRKSILNEFDGIKNSKIGFFQENLAASKNSNSVITGYPGTRFADPLYQSRNETHIGFQALQGWNRPFSNPSKTENTMPEDGLQFGYDTYHAKYFELYTVDLDDKKFHQSFLKWSKILCANTD